MIKAKLWKGNQLSGRWEVTLKIDGVRMLRDTEGNPVSRAGKPLYNLQDIPKAIEDAEVYDKDWESSISLCRTSVNGSPVPIDKVYSLDPIDPRLSLDSVTDPTPEFLKDLMEHWISKGYEGLILRQGDKWLKIKPKETYDVPVTGIQLGTGRNLGLVGALVTPMGKVGSGLNDTLRREFLNIKLGTIIEVDCMGLTTNGKFRHPRFIRVREDKGE